MKWQAEHTSGDGYSELKLYHKPATLRIASQCSCIAAECSKRLSMVTEGVIIPSQQKVRMKMRKEL